MPANVDTLIKSIDRSRLQILMQREQKKFVDERPKSKALFERALLSLLLTGCATAQVASQLPKLSILLPANTPSDKFEVRYLFVRILWRERRIYFAKA